jgi:hypothetical protein
MIYERLYTSLPKTWVPYLLVVCRLVLVEGLVRDAGFCDVSREYMPYIMPSEIIVARKA